MNFDDNNVQFLLQIALQEIEVLKEIVSSQNKKNQKLEKVISNQESQIENLIIINKSQKNTISALTKELDKKKVKKDSSNSGKPPSTDIGKAKRNQSLREKSNRPNGGQKGHTGHYLEQSATPDETILHKPDEHCSCGERLNLEDYSINEERQIYDIPENIRFLITSHQSCKVTCTCGKEHVGKFPEKVKAHSQYGENTQATVAYLSTKQYMSFNRIAEFFKVFFYRQISEGTIGNILNSVTQCLTPAYNQISKSLRQCFLVFSDETSYRYLSEQGWYWVWQNYTYTYISAKTSRGYKSIEEEFEDGFPSSIFISDGLAAQLKTKSKDKQTCIVHILRNLKYVSQVTSTKWAEKLKKLLIDSIKLKKESKKTDFPLKQRAAFEAKVQKLISKNKNDDDEISRTKKHLINVFNYLFTFLTHYEVPPDNNTSESAIRNVKVKNKISGAFRSYSGAHNYAVLRSIIDTSIKNNVDVYQCISKLIKNPQTDINSIIGIPAE
jgi:transposase